VRTLECICLVTSSTRMKGMLKRWGSKGTAKFRMRSARLASLASKQMNMEAADQLAEQDFLEIQREDDSYDQAYRTVRESIDVGLPISVVPREYLPNFDFSMAKAVVVLGQDGLVANTAKYVRGLPIIGVNPDPSRYDGVLLPFQVNEARRCIQRVLKDAAAVRTVTMGRADLNDGQSLLAFNDFFIGCQSHGSARYRIEQGPHSEQHSSSGVIVSTGAGSTGWLSSVYNMVKGFSSSSNETQDLSSMGWEDRALAWVVREPFKSKVSSANMVVGKIEEGVSLGIESLMSERGVIFSDGIEADALEFNTGSIVSIRVADQVARLVVR
jgi:NAD kinase